ncbi:MAG: ATP-binding protein [Candidatus Kerfeldbacteria bacterium]|nr:ATP-binding protein [Candidatus Kerfeldbacteria bacterium]
MKFINRHNELSALEDRFRKNQSEFFIVYGKRRVGKTELIKQFIKDKPSAYFLADKRSMKLQLQEVGRIIGEQFNDEVLMRAGFEEWLEVFQYLGKHVRPNKPFIFAIDEYPYLVEIDKSISSIFQKGWDEYLKNSGVCFILSGSSIAMMESETLIYTAPLYGRRTGQLLLTPLSFTQAHEFFPATSFQEFLSIFTIMGGMPAYLLQYHAHKSRQENMRDAIFEKTAFLHNEVEFTLKEELREPKQYMAIIEAIAKGCAQFGHISNATGLEKNTLTKYLHVLQKLQLIAREVPVSEKHPQKSRKSIYTISDQFFRFWFRFVYPYKSDIEIGRLNEVEKKLHEEFSLLESVTHEQICRDDLVNQYSKQLFPFERVGRWWNNDEEIDIVALNTPTDSVLFAECKWSNKAVGTNVYDDLKRKAALVDFGSMNRKEYYALFSKSGFTKAMIEKAKKEKVLLIEEDRLLK